MMSKALETFFESQLREWQLARDNHEALSRVWSRELISDKTGTPLRVQYNPARMVSTGASIDKASIAARPCFLCAKNRPAEQRSLDLNADFEWLVNPFPILPYHFTIASKVHRPQRILDGYDALIQATLTLPEGYIVFYNGPKCGASAPDHLHLQAGKWDMPLPMGDAYRTYHLPCAEATDAFRTLYDSLPLVDNEDEPRMNVVAYRRGEHVDLIVIPRRAHRPHCYASEGPSQYLISPGTLDMCGLIITPRLEDYERLTATRALDILCEVGVRTEPTIDVGIMQGNEIEFEIAAPSEGSQPILAPATYRASLQKDDNNGKFYIVIKGEDTEYTIEDSVMLIAPSPCDRGGERPFFSLHGVTIGKEFHWQQQETQTFQGSLLLRIIDDELHAINRIPIEEYLTSVIASEMSGTSSVELLKAHAIISRSWLLAQLAVSSEKLKNENSKLKIARATPEDNSQFSIVNSQFIKWYDREAHTHFDVCADDHCQRYQGVSRKVTPQVYEAIRATRGIVLSYEGEVCDARFSKCCGGITELYESCWDDTPHPYLSVVHDPFCNTDDPKILSEVLNHYDQSTDFYRWTVEYTRSELSDLVRHRSGFDYGDILDLIPIERGPSGRIVRLQIVGTKATRIIGKELEIRRTLSESHLYSSAFDVEKRGTSFVLHGSGWGHGVGLCQIGAAVMGAQGYGYQEILHHYYPEAALTEWYE